MRMAARKKEQFSQQHGYELYQHEDIDPETLYSELIVSEQIKANDIENLAFKDQLEAQNYIEEHEHVEWIPPKLKYKDPNISREISKINTDVMKQRFDSQMIYSLSELTRLKEKQKDLQNINDRFSDSGFLHLMRQKYAYTKKSYDFYSDFNFGKGKIDIQIKNQKDRELQNNYKHHFEQNQIEINKRRGYYTFQDTQPDTSKYNTYEQFDYDNRNKINVSNSEPDLRQTVSMIRKVRDLNRKVRAKYNGGGDERDQHDKIEADHMFYLIDKKMRYTEKF